MGIDKYQAFARSTAVYPNIGNNLWYPALGLAGEAGEVADKVKKIYRDSTGLIDITTRNQICKELGDVLWYVAAVASELKIPLSMVVKMNVSKLKSRQTKNSIHGSGDER